MYSNAELATSAFSGGNYGGLGGGLGPPQSAMSSENWGFRRIIDNRLTCRNYYKKSF